MCGVCVALPPDHVVDETISVTIIERCREMPKQPFDEVADLYWAEVAQELHVEVAA